MSDNVNAAIVAPMGIDVLGQYQKWQALQQAQNANALTQQQIVNAQQTNQLGALNLGLTNYRYGLLGIPGAGGAAPAGGAPGSALPQGASPAVTASSGALPAGAAAPQYEGATGMRLFGIPMPATLAVSAMQDPKLLSTISDMRRQNMYTMLSVPPAQLPQSVAAALQAGWIDPQTASDLLAHPEHQEAARQAFATPESHLSATTALAGQGNKFDPATGQIEPDAGPIATKGDVARVEAFNRSAGELPLAGSLAAAGAQGAATAETVDVPQQATNPDGTPKVDASGAPVMIQTKVNKARLAAASAALPSGAAPAQTAPYPARSELPPIPADADNPLLRGIPSNMLPPGAAGAANLGWGQSPPNVPMTPRPSALPAGAAAAPVAPGVGALPAGAAPVPTLAPTPAAPTTAGVPGISTGMPSLTPQQSAALEVGKSKTIAQNASDITAMQGYREKTVEASASAQTQNAILDQMRSEAAGFDHGSFANVIQGIKKDVGSFAQVFGGAVPDSVASWEDFQKNFGTLARSTATALSSRVGLGELELVQKYLPSATMSAQGFNRIADQLQGLNDYAQAKATAAANFQGNPAQFESTFQKSVTPGAFIVARMPPADLKIFLDNMNSTAEGRATVAKIRAGIAYARENGLMQDGAQ